MAKNKDFRKFSGQYRNGAEGFIAFCEEFLCVSIYPKGQSYPVWTPIKDLPADPHPITGRSYLSLWEEHKAVVREGLAMENGEFKYRRIVLCWGRGDGKSFLACLIVIWKWMNFPKQDLVLCANSKEQSTFVHYDEIKDIILNSPKLLAVVGAKNVGVKEIRLRDSAGNVVSRIFSASTFTGILSNITGYTFSEMFQLKNHKFFEEIDTSTRNVPNALGVIDSTISVKDHPLYSMYKNTLNGKDPTTYFSYRFSANGKQEDFWHPNQTQAQLDSFRVIHHVGRGFDRFFKNLWDAGSEKVFSKEQVDAIYYLGAFGSLNNHMKILEAVTKKNKIEKHEQFLMEKRGLDGETYDKIHSSKETIADIEKGLMPADKFYQLRSEIGTPRQCTVEELNTLGDMYDTDWSILLGMDRAQPMKKRTNARTIITAIAKGLPQSRTRPELGTLEAPKYIYILLNLTHVASSRLDDIKAAINDIEEEYNGIDSYFSETWGTFDLADFCEDKDIRFEVKTPTQALQISMFTELYIAIEAGRFKSAEVHIDGSKGSNILSEELLEFDHDPEKNWFGSTEKSKKYGIQDDVIFALACTIYGGRFLTVDDFERRAGIQFFGAFYEDRNVIGNYQ